jgi:predicted glycosyltransferase
MRVLYISGSIGLGHADRDLAIARELRRLDPEIEIDWLAGAPARDRIAEAGETLLPDCRLLDETAQAERVSDGFGFNVLGAIARSRGNPLEHLLAYRINRAWSGGRTSRASAADLTLFVGEPDDIPDRRFGLGLPNRRDHARHRYRFVGYVLRFDPADYADKQAVRRAHGYDDRPLIVAAIGGTAVGAGLLRLCADAHPHVAERVPDARMVLVCGRRCDPGQVHAPPGVEPLGYVPNLYGHLAACDAAIVQAGGTTTLELTALRRPFAYFPLANHFEQQLVAARIERHGAGHRLDFAQTTPTDVARTIVKLLGERVRWPPIRTDGAQRAARLIAALGQGAARMAQLAPPSPDMTTSPPWTAAYSSRAPLAANASGCAPTEPACSNSRPPSLERDTCPSPSTTQSASSAVRTGLRSTCSSRRRWSSSKASSTTAARSPARRPTSSASRR